MPAGPRSVTGIVLAGGRSSRFGRDKLAEVYRGMPLLHHAVARLRDVCDTIVVVIAPDAPEPTLPEGAAVVIARDARPFGGPLSGATAGLNEVRTTLALVTGGDMPEPEPAVLARMLETASEEGVEAVVLGDAPRFRPLPSVVDAERARSIGSHLLAGGERRLRSMLEAMRVSVLDEATWRALDPEGRTLFDVDELDDLRE